MGGRQDRSWRNVVDVVEDYGIRTAILNVSFTCHMPDCLEMPYHPAVRDAKTYVEGTDEVPAEARHVYRLGGNSCLSGDYMGLWAFDHELPGGREHHLRGYAALHHR